MKTDFRPANLTKKNEIKAKKEKKLHQCVDFSPFFSILRLL